MLLAEVLWQRASRQQEMRASKVAELEKYSAMLANPRLPQEAKLSVGASLTNVAKELSAMQQSEAASGGIGGSARQRSAALGSARAFSASDGAGFATPSNTTPSKASSVSSGPGSERSTPNK